MTGETAARSRRSPFARLNIVDYILAAVSLGVGAYYVLNDDYYYYNFVEGITSISTREQAVGVVLVALSVEACRRTIGWGLTSVVVILIAYVAFGHLLGGELHHGAISLPYFLTLQTLTHVGIFGAPIQVAATYAFLFVLFGAFYQRAGGGQLFFDLAAVAAGRSVGGPAKACVVSSGALRVDFRQSNCRRRHDRADHHPADEAGGRLGRPCGGDRVFGVGGRRVAAAGHGGRRLHDGGVHRHSLR